MNKPITIELETLNTTTVVKKLPIGRYAELFKQMRELPKRLKGFDNTNNDALFEQLPDIIADVTPEFIDMLVVATDLEKEQVEQLGLDEIVSLVLAVLEVNKYKEVYDKIKKALARPAQETKTIATK